LGDNLGIHSITGFVESFSANYPCQICKVHKEIMRKQCYVDETLIRLVDDYNFDLIENNVSSSGISGIYVWNDVRGFKIFDHVGVDMMHDLLEGVMKYDLSFLISYYVLELKLFSLEVLNMNELVWYLYISLRRILDILTSTSFQIECSKLLITLVAKHNELYLLLSKNNLKPKYHYLLHYHTMM